MGVGARSYTAYKIQLHEAIPEDIQDDKSDGEETLAEIPISSVGNGKRKFQKIRE